MRKGGPAYACVAVGVSAGGTSALQGVLPALPVSFSLSVIVVQHIGPGSTGYFIEALDRRCRVSVKEAQEKEELLPGTVYFAPADYHLMVERDRTFSLSIDAKVHYARPSIDVLFETAAETYGPELVGIVMTGANADGAQGLRAVKEHGGLAVVQDPRTAESPVMPQAAMDACSVDHVLSLDEIAALLQNMVNN